jgi:hypothetical protein
MTEKFTMVKNCSIILFRIILLILVCAVLALMFRVFPMKRYEVLQSLVSIFRICKSTSSILRLNALEGVYCEGVYSIIDYYVTYSGKVEIGI